MEPFKPSPPDLTKSDTERRRMHAGNTGVLSFEAGQVVP